MINRSSSSMVSNPIICCFVTHWGSTTHGMRRPQHKKTVRTYRPLERGPIIVVIMYITETTRPGPNGTGYRCVLLRQSYREGGQVKNRTLANLSPCTPQEIEAIRVALQHKDDLAVLGTLQKAPMQEALSVVAVSVIYELARRLGIATALGTDVAGKLA